MIQVKEVKDVIRTSSKKETLYTCNFNNMGFMCQSVLMHHRLSKMVIIIVCHRIIIKVMDVIHAIQIWGFRVM